MLGARLAPGEEYTALITLRPLTLGMWGGGSVAEAQVVREERGWVVVGVEESKSV